ncbi:unnamed protein product, partial [Phaeothamnion confervicola]
MQTTSRRTLLSTAGKATLGGIALGALPTRFASAAAQDAAPIENGASQVAITLTGDDGGTCVLDY